MMDKAAMKFELIYEITLDPDNPYTIQQLCSLNHVSRSGYYNWLSSREAHAQREEQDRADFELILKAATKKNRPKGVKQIYMNLLHLNPSVVMNQKKIRRLCKKFGLVCSIRKANPYRQMAKALKTSTVAGNLVERKFE